jgi:hypothetical protein
MTHQTLPFAPLDEFVTRWVRERGQHIRADDGGSREDTAIAEALGVGRAQVNYMRRNGVVSVHVADRMAIGLRIHPSLIWTRDWWSVEPIADRSTTGNDNDRRRERRRERAEYARVWAQVDHEFARALRAVAYAESWALREELWAELARSRVAVA